MHARLLLSAAGAFNRPYLSLRESEWNVNLLSHRLPELPTASSSTG